MHSKLQKADRAQCVRLEVERNHISFVQVVHLPVDLLFELVVGDILLPRAVPVAAARVKDRDGKVTKGESERRLPIYSLAHFDAAGEEDRGASKVWPDWRLEDSAFCICWEIQRGSWGGSLSGHNGANRRFQRVGDLHGGGCMKMSSDREESSVYWRQNVWMKIAMLTKKEDACSRTLWGVEKARFMGISTIDVQVQRLSTALCAATDKPAAGKR